MDDEIIDNEIIENRYNANEIITNGELVKASDYREVYIHNGVAAKVCLKNSDSEQLKRLGTYLPQNLVPETVVREEQLDALNGFQNSYPVAIQKTYDTSLKEKLERSEHFEEIGDVIHLLDSITGENAVMTDPIIENFNYFDDKLKVNDLCDIESMKSFPGSFDPRIAETEYHNEVEDMYEDALTSLRHHTGLETQELANIFTDTSRHIQEIDIGEDPLLGPMPQAKTVRLTNRY